MMFLPGLAVIFAGLLGGNGDVDKQVKKVLSDLQVKNVSVPAASLQKLTRYGAATRAVVQNLHADGVIACEVIKGQGTPSLRVVIYAGDGRLKTFSEVPLTGKKLGRGTLEALRSNLADEVRAMRADDAPTQPAVAIEPPAAGAAQRVSAARPVQPPAKVERETAGVDNEVPAGLATEDATAADDAVSADEIAAVSASSGDTASAAPSRSLHLGASAGIGIATRAFAPGATGVLPYSSSPVPALVLDAHVQPTNAIRVAIGTERTLQLSTPMGDGSVAATTISRWDAAGTFSLIQRDAVDIGFRVGGGRRTFAIDSNDSARSPDREYNYVIAGVAATLHLGQRIMLRAGAAFEPVLFGSEPTEMGMSEAVRWAVEVGAAAEVRASKHVFVRAAAHYQRFTWSWQMAGASGDEGATDVYPSGVISVGAEY